MTAIAQYKIVIEKEPSSGVFNFTKHWDYPWYIIKDDWGKFSSTEGDAVTAKDTAHIYFTANCRTNVQGGYKIRYCRASRTANKIMLTLYGGLPAYATEYHIVIERGQCTFKTEIIYPELVPGQKITYAATVCDLTLYQQDYSTSKMISGHINAKFTESLIDKSNKKITRNYFLTGYFNTPVKS